MGITNFFFSSDFSIGISERFGVFVLRVAIVGFREVDLLGL